MICHTPLSAKNPAYEDWSESEQLNSSYLQVENEHYACIRPKQSQRQQGERPLLAIQKHGIEYLELRCLDIQSSVCCGIDLATLLFSQLLLYHCIIEDSPLMEPNTKEYEQAHANYLRAVWQGRQPDCKIQRADKERLLGEQGQELCRQLRPLAERFDQEHESSENLYSMSLALQEEKFREPEKTPSARTLASMANQEIGYIEFGLRQAQEHQKNIGQLSREKQASLERLAKDSLKKYQQLKDEQAPIMINLNELPVTPLSTKG